MKLMIGVSPPPGPFFWFFGKECATNDNDARADSNSNDRRIFIIIYVSITVDWLA